MLAKAHLLRYTTNCCDMIAMKREVAACVTYQVHRAGFPWSECQKPAQAGQETGDKSLYKGKAAWPSPIEDVSDDAQDQERKTFLAKRTV